MKGLPIGIQTFSKLIEGGFIYVDKTEYIHSLFANGGQYYFLSRPRRFGKSLLVSTLKEIFSGNKELFKGLWIYDKIAWKKHPIIHIDFLGLKYSSKKELAETLDYLVEENAGAHRLKLQEKSYDKKFKELIIRLSQKNRVVVLIDEYDKPIIDFVDNEKLALENRDILRSFYSTIKGADEYLQFAFFTGVSKFSRVSVFSGLNNLNDITMDERYATMLGYTQGELESYFQGRIEQMAAGWGISQGELLAKIREWYNGYSWQGKDFVYNPFSILQFFDKKSFDNYWFSSGTPTFLVKKIKEFDIDTERFEKYETNQFLFDSYDIDRMNVFSLLFQTGYLTVKAIKETSSGSRIYELSYPNREVKESLNHLINDKNYYEKYLAANKQIKLVGIGFDVAKKNIADHKTADV